MFARKHTQFVATGLVVLALVGCMPAAAPTEAPIIAPEPTVAVAPAFDVEAAVTQQLAMLPEGFSGIKPDALREQMAAAAPFIIDVREPAEIAETGFIEGAINIPIRDLGKSLALLPAQDQPIVIVCKSGHRGGIAVATLQMLGYTNVRSLVGGMNAWLKAEFPVSTGTMMVPVAGVAPMVDAQALSLVDGYLSALPDGFGTLPADKLSEQMAAATPFLLDVREASEVAETGLIAGAVNIPVRELGANLAQLPAMDQPIVVICASGHRASIAMADLQLLGYTNVKSLAGGMNAWIAAELPVVK